ncbi:sulfatase [Novipirellula rosea]|uniref:sulfatase n=1 Tax=Novipirellula rosea TaxID=1031540 RepID=UPI0031ECECBF
MTHAAHGKVSADHPNVLFIAVDDLNTWAMGLSSEYLAKTPHMNALAKRGVLFSNAHCAAPVCSPSRVSVMTGVAPSTSGVYQNKQDWRECSRLRDHVTLPQHFRNQGYKVIGGGKLYHAANLSEKMLTGYLDPRPWHEYFPSKQRQLPDEFIPPGNSRHGSNQFYGGRFDWDALDIDDSEMGDAKVVAWAETQLSRQHDKPLFIGVGIYRPHIPWYTPKKWFSEYPIDDVPLPTASEDDLIDIPNAAKAMSKHAWHGWLVENEKWDDAVQAYLASVSFADAMVGRLLAALDRGPLAENTVIVLWSDHGYHLGHKQHWEKRVLWEQATKVPLVISDYRLKSSGRRCERPVSLLDLYPTLVDLCELDPVGSLDGRSLKPLLIDPAAESDRLVCTTYKPGNHSVRSQNWRYIKYADGSEELYDHRADPRENHNLATKPAHDALKQRLAKGLPKSDAITDPKLKIADQTSHSK